MKSSKILELAKKRLPNSFTDYYSNDVSPYICDHIEAVGDNNNMYDKAEEIKAKISELIEHKFSLASWLIDKGYATSYQILANPEKMQQTRKNFIDDLIQYYKQQGD